MNKLNRRDFLKMAGALGLTVGVSPIIASCATPAAAPTAVPPTAVPPTAVPPTAAPAAGAEKLVVKAVAKTSKDPKDIKIYADCFIANVPYTDAFHEGMKQAAASLGCQVLFSGPSNVDHKLQAAEIDTWITQGVDAISPLVGDAELLTPYIDKAVDAGIAVIPWDSDASKSKRQVFNSQGSDDDFAKAQFDQLALEMGGEGEWAFIIGQLTQELKMYQFNWMRQYQLEKFPKMKLVDFQACGDDSDKAKEITKQLTIAHPNLKGIVSNSGAGPAGVPTGLKELGLKPGEIAVTGLCIPSITKVHFHDGYLKKGFLWDQPKYGYRYVMAAWKLLHGEDIIGGETVVPKWDGDTSVADVRYSLLNPEKLDLILAPPLEITVDNVDSFTF